MRMNGTGRKVDPSTLLVRRIVADSGHSQAELARRAGMPRSVLNVYLRGRREPGANALIRLAGAAGFDLGLERRNPRVDPQRAGKILVQVLELAEALPFRPRAEIGFQPLGERLGETA